MKTYFYQLEKYKPTNEHKFQHVCVGVLLAILILFAVLG